MLQVILDLNGTLVHSKAKIHLTPPEENVKYSYPCGR